jgi:hypothetical protein
MMRAFFSIGMGVLLLLHMQGCATIVTGTTQEMTFDSEPDGVTVVVNGRVIGKTPVTIQLKKKSDQSITFKKEGYKTQTRQLSTSTQGWFWGNILIGGFIGSTVDGVSGAIYEYSPSQYYVTLAPESSGVNMTEKAEVKAFIVASYRQIMEDLSKREGEYLSSLLILLKIKEDNKEDAIKKISSLAELYYPNIPEFAEQVTNYYLKK